jgi:hypothetical protein
MIFFHKHLCFVDHIGIEALMRLEVIIVTSVIPANAGYEEKLSSDINEVHHQTGYRPSVGMTLKDSYSKTLKDSYT